MALATDSCNSSNFGVKMSEILHFPGKSLGRSLDSCFSALTITPEMGPGGYPGLGAPTEQQGLRSLTPGSTPGVQNLSRHAEFFFFFSQQADHPHGVPTPADGERVGTDERLPFEISSFLLLVSSESRPRNPAEVVELRAESA